MTDPDPIEAAKQPLEYSRPIASAGKTVFLVIAILLAVGVGLLSGLAALIMVNDSRQWWLGAILIGGIVLLTIGAVVAKRLLGISAALAILLASICTFLLMVGTCSQFRFVI